MALTPARMATPLVVKGIGIPILKQYGIMDKLQAAVENKKSINTRQGSLFAVRFSQCSPPPMCAMYGSYGAMYVP